MRNRNAVLPPWYYRWLIGFTKPLYRLMLAFKKRQLLFYEMQINDRFGGKYTRPTPKGGKVIWCHAVSLGELNTAYPLLRSLLEDGHALYITSTTQTGFVRASTLFADEIVSGQVVHSFVPIDVLVVVYRFLMYVRPDLTIFVETELWANTLFCLYRHEVPSVLINARLKDKSFSGYKKFARLSKSMMSNLSLVIAQDQKSYDNFLALGLDADKLKLSHSLKWSQPLSRPKDEMLISSNRPIWTAGSTHDGEESLVLAAHKQILQSVPNALLVLVPRHPERFSAVYELCQKSGLSVVCRSKDEPITDTTQVYLADTMGELVGFYALSSVAFVGGSLVDGIGGHNPIEPISVGIPVVMGKFTKSCDELVAELLTVGACQVVDGLTLADAVIAWLDKSASKQAGQAGQMVFFERQNAYLEQKSYLLPYL